MIPYILCFAMVIGIAWLQERMLKENGGQIPSETEQKSLFWGYTAAIILLPAFLAGVRDVHIGTDVIPYITPTFEYAIGSRTLEQLQQICTESFLGNTEEGFLLIAFLITRFTDNIHWFLFAVSLFIGSVTWFTLYRMRNRCSLLVGETIYLFICYNEGLNIARQCMALAVYLLAMSFVLERSYIKGFLICLIGYFFHRSMLFGGAVLVAIALFQELSPVWDRKYMALAGQKKGAFSAVAARVPYPGAMRMGMAAALIVLAVVLLLPVAGVMYQAGMLPEKYGFFLTENNKDTFIWKAYLLYIASYAVLFLYGKKLWHRDEFRLLAFADCAFYLLYMWMPFLYRVSLFFLYARVLAFSQMRVEFPPKWERDHLYGYAAIVLSLLFWLGFTVFWNNNETIPYQFMGK
ncbi:MAG: EpsG family protein [Lachnospiraceae bacterium]|nr:EpsG family protein [Lachnospiraceae bacterium]